MQFNASHKGPIYRTDFCPSRTFLLLELVAGEDLIDRRKVLVLEPECGKTSIQVILCYGNFEIVVEEACPGGRPLGRDSQDAPGLLQMSLVKGLGSTNKLSHSGHGMPTLVSKIAFRN
jgi:hypothetical protein